MSTLIDRTGIFKARPVSWAVRRKDGSKTVSINFKFLILDMLMNGTWHDWMQYGEFHVYGDWFVVKRDGGINQVPVEQLAGSLGWNGSFSQISAGPPPDVVVQIRVEAEEYTDKEGVSKVSMKATWMNPGDYQPQARGEGEESTRELDTMFGSQMRAITSAAPKPASKPTPPKAERVSPSDATAPVGPEFPNTDPDGDDWVPPELREEDARSRQ